LIPQRLAGAVSRALPRAHGPFERWLSRHPGDRALLYRDAGGLWRTADLRDHLERAWFAGVPSGLPPSVVARVPPGTLAIDVGANIGTVSGQLARAVRDRGRVWSIEPVPRNVERLTELAERNRLPIDVIPVAAGEADGDLALRLPEDGRSGWASATASWIESGRLTVPMRSVDSLVAERRPPWPVSLVKIDVEGYEAEVLAGAAETLATWRPRLYVEFNDLAQVDRGASSRELLERLAAAGYVPADRWRDTARRLDGAVVDVLLEPVAPRRRC
jgi:FkbM family methyltransferase